VWKHLWYEVPNLFVPRYYGKMVGKDKTVATAVLPSAAILPPTELDGLVVDTSYCVCRLFIPRYIQAPSKCSTTAVYTIVHPIIAYAHDHDGGAARSAPARSCCEADIRR
jgi:hypothetical protein